MATVELRRHGDVMIKTFKGFKIPKEAKLKKTVILHQGNNNTHAFKSGDVMSGELAGKRYLKVKRKAVIDHAEHGKGDVPPGDYYVEIKSEYDHFLEESRKVID